MIRSLIVADDVLDDPDAVRRMALAQDFGPVEYDGFTYEGVATAIRLDLAGAVSDLLGEPVAESMQFWRISPAGDAPTSWIHADTGCAEWAAILYLSPPGSLNGGTAFWTHRETGASRLGGLLGRGDDPAALAEALRDDADDKSRWRMTDLAGLRYNRLAVYPSECFHSRYPAPGWGSGETARLVWVGFFGKE